MCKRFVCFLTLPSSVLLERTVTKCQYPGGKESKKKAIPEVSKVWYVELQSVRKVNCKIFVPSVETSWRTGRRIVSNAWIDFPLSDPLHKIGSGNGRYLRGLEQVPFNPLG
mmetsp:Transcript_90992/g.136304  ORF Transcript_90992/g.136304 Transcript_90992/m.136304 type:complete len:111 (+) Transcript_90992:196-528(+)